MNEPSLRTQLARELIQANLAHKDAHPQDRAKRDIERYREMLRLLELPLETEIVIPLLTDEQVSKLLTFLRIYNKPDKTRYDWLALEALFKEDSFASDG